MPTTSPLLIKIEQKIDELEQQVKNTHFTHFAEHFFDEHLFDKPDNNENPSFYLTKIRETYQTLTNALTAEDQEKASIVSEMLINQITALSRELSTHSLRIEEPVAVYETVTQKHARHLDYLRRLREMKFALELDSDLIDYSKLAAMENRIYRCEQAIKKIEIELENSESETKPSL